MLDFSVIVMVRLKGGETPNNKIGLGTLASNLENVCLDYIFCLMDQMVRIRNLGVRLARLDG